MPRRLVSSAEEAHLMMREMLKQMTRCGEIWIDQKVRGNDTSQIEDELKDYYSDFRYYERRYRILKRRE